MADIDLISVSDLQSYSNTGTQGTPSAQTLAVMQEIITGWSQAVYWICGRTPDMLKEVVEFTEIYNGTGSDVLYVINAPIISVQSLLINGGARSASSGYGAAGYFIQEDKKSIALRCGSSAALPASAYPFGGRRNVFPQGRGNISLSYTAGYDGVPPDLFLLSLKQCTILLNKRSREDEASHMIPNSGQTNYREWALQPEVCRFLEPYKRGAMVNIF